MPWYTPCMIPSPWCPDCGLSLLLWCISLLLWVSIRWQRQRDFGAIIPQISSFWVNQFERDYLGEARFGQGRGGLTKGKRFKVGKILLLWRSCLVKGRPYTKDLQKAASSSHWLMQHKIGKSALQTQKLDSANDLYGSRKTLSSGSEHTPADTWLQLWETLPVTRVIF